MVRMKTPIGKQISGMLSSEKQGGLPHDMLDLLRVLVVYNGAIWKSELVQELGLFHAFREKPGAVDKGKLDKVLKELKKEGLVIVEEQVRGTLDAKEGVRDELISLADYRATYGALSKDKILASYRLGR